MNWIFVGNRICILLSLELITRLQNWYSVPWNVSDAFRPLFVSFLNVSYHTMQFHLPLISSSIFKLVKKVSFSTSEPGFHKLTIVRLNSEKFHVNQIFRIALESISFKAPVIKTILLDKENCWLSNVQRGVRP